MTRSGKHRWTTKKIHNKPSASGSGILLARARAAGATRESRAPDFLSGLSLRSISGNPVNGTYTAFGLTQIRGHFLQGI